MSLDTFGKRLEHARNQAGLSKAEVARRLNIDIKNVRAYIADTRKPLVHRIARIAEVVGVSEAWLMTGKETFEEAEPELMEAENEVEFLIEELRTAIAKRMKIPAERVVVQPQLHYPKFESPVGRDFPA